MTAVPWEGPPPVSLRGLGAIIAQSAMNPQLDPAVRSNMTGRNYFLLSKNYCNLSVRLGYHFALAEASFSELLTESYVNFQFQGGAADERRRRAAGEAAGRDAARDRFPGGDQGRFASRPGSRSGRCLSQGAAAWCWATCSSTPARWTW